MTRLSVNINKIALVRNSRGNNTPDVLHYASIAVDEGADGITIHPREDERHVKLSDIIPLASYINGLDHLVEFNIEGDPRPELLDIVTEKIHAHQFTLVPVTKGEITSNRGWRNSDGIEHITDVVRHMKEKRPNMRISMFADATEESVLFCKTAGADAIEFYTGDYAMAGPDAISTEIERLQRAASMAKELGLAIHAGHDLDLNNLPRLLSTIRPDEVSIGHALLCDALDMGFREAVRRYLAVVHA